MSWLFSRALVEAFSEASSLDGEPCAPLSVMPTLHKFWRNDKMMEFSKLSQFGLTCAVLTEDRGLELLTSFLADFPARTSAPLERVRGSVGVDPVSGLSLPASLARFDPDTLSWRTAPSLLAEVSEPFLGTWPRWGTMRNGVSWGLKMPALPTSGTGYGSWPTPRATAAMAYGVAGRPDKACRLEDVVANFPTPMASDCEARGMHRGKLDTLTSFTKAFPTPCARDYRSPNSLPFSERGGGKKGEQLVNFIAHFLTPTATNTKANHMRGADKGKAREPRSYFPTPTASTGGPEPEGKTGRKLATVAGGQLNPPWVEWLMGWPIGWTDLKPLETAKFQQ